MGLAAREGVRRHYSLERMAEDMLNLYARLREGKS